MSFPRERQVLSQLCMPDCCAVLRFRTTFKRQPSKTVWKYQRVENTDVEYWPDPICQTIYCNPCIAQAIGFWSVFRPNHILAPGFLKESIAIGSVVGEHMRQDLVGGGTQVAEFFASWPPPFISSGNMSKLSYWDMCFASGNIGCKLKGLGFICSWTLLLLL